jgi:uncharacterized cupin superfamily protein
MERINLFNVPVQYDEPDPEGFRAGMARVGSSIGASMLGGSVYELPPGQSNCPYHYEYGNEEWLIVLSGRVTVRHPDGHEDFDPGDVVCFPEGPAGAHRLTNHGDETVRVLMISTMVEPNAAVYPDSDKIGMWPGGGNADKIMVRRSSAVDYYDGER